MRSAQIDGARGPAVALWGLTGLFALRVLGRVLVAYHLIQAVALVLIHRGAARGSRGSFMERSGRPR